MFSKVRSDCSTVALEVNCVAVDETLPFDTSLQMIHWLLHHAHQQTVDIRKLQEGLNAFSLQLAGGVIPTDLS